MRRPYENKQALDPGRLNHKIAFYRMVASDDGYGGSGPPVETLVLSTKASKQRISANSVGESQQMVTEAGATAFNQDSYFVIRNRKGFYPQKNDKVVVGGIEEYTINGIVPLDDPLTFIKLLCVRKA